MKKTFKYVYPDPGDSITIEMINQFEHKPGYWERSEKSVLSVAKQFVRQAASNGKGTLLDAGCGQGRLIPVFERFFSKILALEPDLQRFGEAVKLVKQTGLGEKVELVNASIEDMPEGEFNAILCSHVLQHISLAATEEVFRKFQQNLADRGVLILLTCNSSREEDFFTKSFFEKGKWHEQEISKEGFERLVVNQVGELPARFFSLNTIKDLLAKYGFEFIIARRFHRFRGKGNGRDIMVIGKKKS